MKNKNIEKTLSTISLVFYFIAGFIMLLMFFPGVQYRDFWIAMNVKQSTLEANAQKVYVFLCLSVIVLLVRKIYEKIYFEKSSKKK